MHRTHCRLPRAGIDLVDDATTALAFVAIALTQPIRPETIVLVLDPDRRGRSIVSISGTERPDDVLGVVECLAHADGEPGFVIASVRAPGAGESELDGRSDADRWLEMSEIAEAAGCEVIEWFVIDDDIWCPRDRLGEPPRW